MKTSISQTGARKAASGVEDHRLTSTTRDGYASSRVPLYIPDEHLPAIGKILKLSDAAATDLIDALSSASIASTAPDMAKQIAPKISGISLADLTEIVDLLYALYHVREFSEVRRARFLQDLIESIRTNPDFNLQKREDAPRLRKRFQRLLNIQPLNTLSKAIKLQREGERLYCSAKIVSDIRPIFGEDITSRPVSAVITHTLKIGYHEGGEHRDLFLVLDEQDLGRLQEVIERAKSKGQTLAELLNDTGLPRLGL